VTVVLQQLYFAAHSAWRLAIGMVGAFVILSLVDISRKESSSD